MANALPELTIAPLLVAASTIAARRWGARAGGLISAFPAVVGPVLLILAQQHGGAFAAGAADGTLLGLIALSGFAVVYGRMARHARWLPTLAVAWVAAAALAASIALIGHSPPFALAFSGGTVSLLLAYRALPTAREDPVLSTAVFPRGEIPLRMALTVALVLALTAAAGLLGPVAGGVLSALPVPASVLAAFTHGRLGADAVVGLLRGMLAGMSSFVAFCAVIVLLIVPAGTAIAFAAALLAALGLQALALGARRGGRPQPSAAAAACRRWSSTSRSWRCARRIRSGISNSASRGSPGSNCSRVRQSASFPVIPSASASSSTTRLSGE